MNFKVPIRPELEQLVPYVPGKSAESVASEFGLSNVIKLASNENALGASVDIGELITQDQALFRYPDSGHLRLCAAIGKFYGVAANQVVLGNGSDEVIQMIGLAFFQSGDEVLSSASAFSEYRFTALVCGVNYREIPLVGYSVNLIELAKNATERTRAIFVANPHNPTGTAFTHTDVLAALRIIPNTCLLILDEAYAEFADMEDFPRFQALIDDYPNLVILRTFSKIYGLAGIRIGYGIGCRECIGALNKVRQPFNVNRISLAAGERAIQNQSFVEKSRQLIVDEKKRICAVLERENVKVIPSQANFVCIQVKRDAREVANDLMKLGIIVRPLNSFELSNHIRVTISIPSENDQFLSALFSIQGVR